MADNCVSYDCNDPLGDHTLNTCNEERQGGADWILMLECDAVLNDPSSETEINALIAANQATLISEVNVSFPVPAPVVQASNVPGRAERLITNNRELALVDANVNADNVDFYDTMADGREFGGAVIGECCNEVDRVHFIDAAITFTGGNQLPNTDDTRQDFQLAGKWKSKNNPSIHAAPAGIP